MKECCANCAYKTRLKRKFVLGKGHEESICCTLFAKEQDGFVLELEDDDGVCEEYRKLL